SIFEPVLSYQLSGERKPRLSIIVDVSGSMQAEISGASRLATVDSLLAARPFKELASRYELSRHFLAESLLVTRPDALVEDGLISGGTALGEALDALAGSEAADPADVWLLLSDGISNTGREPTQVAATLPVPIITVGVGAVDDGFDIELETVDYNPVVYVGGKTPIKARLRWRNAGESSGDAVISLREDGKPITEERIKLGRGALSAEVELSYTPQSPGGKFLEVLVASATPEKMNKNNARTFSMKALKSRIQALLVTSALNWDYKFLRQALSINKRVEVTEVISKAPGAYFDRAFPSSPAELNHYDVVVLYNPPGVRADDRYARLSSFVSRQGGGLFVFLGDRFSEDESGKLVARRTLDSLLPYRAQSGPAQVTVRATALAIRSDNILHPALRISEGAGDSREDWREFAPFSFIAPLTEAVPGALSLAESDYEILSEAGDQSAISALSALRLGSGKILCLNGGPLWRMAFQSVDSDAAQARFAAFLNGAVNWLAVSEDISPVKIRPEREVFSRGEPILFSATAFDQGYRELENVEGDVYLYSEDLRDTLVASLEKTGAGMYRATFEGVTPGRYRYEGRAVSDGAPLTTDTGSIQIAPYSLEERETTPRFATLQTISQRSGGRYFHITQSSALPEALDGAPITVADEVEIPFRGPWQFLLVFVAALSLEWALRKRYQLL
ncbi:MAG: hypothetical protein ACE5GA_01795, partial [Candidatus Zixiibacteriota bacterium]